MADGNVVDFFKNGVVRKRMEAETLLFVKLTLASIISKYDQLKIVMDSDVVHMPILSRDNSESIETIFLCMEIAMDEILNDKEFMATHEGDGTDVVMELEFIDRVINRSLILFMTGGFKSDV